MNLKPLHVEILRALRGEDEGSLPGELALALAVAQHTICEALDELSDEGFLDCRTDRIASPYVLTDTGAKRLRQYEGRSEGHQHRAVHRYWTRRGDTFSIDLDRARREREEHERQA